MGDGDGTFGTFEPVQGVMVCRGCDAPSIYVREWKSSDGTTENHQYKCFVCGASWWGRRKDEDDGILGR